MCILPLLPLLGALTAATPGADLSVTASARAIRQGELVVLTIRSRVPSTTMKVRAFDRDLPAVADGASAWRVFVGIDLSVPAGTYDVAIEGSPGDQKTVFPLVVASRRFPTRTLTVDPAFVTPPPEARERIERETRELESLWEAAPTPRLWSGAFVRPVPHTANSAFGTHSVFNGEPRSQHGGADFRSPAGTPIKAPNAGRVVIAGPRYFPGNTVVVDHGLGVLSLFAHLSSMTVKTGDQVRAGQVIGTVGATGRVTGPHLHWAVRVNGARVDPLSLLAVLGRKSPRAR